MKKKLLALFVAIISVTAILAFAGCGNNGGNGESKNANVVLDVEKVAFTASNDYIALSTSTSVKNYLDALAENREIKYAANDGFTTSFFNTSSKIISSTVNSYEGYDWAFYIDFTTIEGDDAIYATDYKTIEYGGKTLYYSSNGIAGTPCIDGHLYVFVYEYSNFSW